MPEFKTIIYLIIPILYVILKRYYEKYFAEKRSFSDEELLLQIARFRKLSEYDIFYLSAKNWHISEPQVENDFKVYLLDGHLPHYVRDFIRKNDKALDPRCRKIHNSGGNLPSSWSA